jgi:predicted Ser/Thr protein kinase/Tfp pilus assembly protein PilF
VDSLPDAPSPRYRLDRLLGSGGMGSVYLGRDLSLDRPVAIKFIASDKAGRLPARRRLIREARAAAALDHPNICTVYEVIEDPDGEDCIVMQYVEGDTLASMLRDGPLEARTVLRIAADLTAALSAAHKRGIIHRDIKPQNIVITPDGRAKLLDFGIAYRAGPTAPSDDVSTVSRLTETGETPGTPAYMSPEQVRGRAVDGRSDLFALGAVLYECLTGRRAFDGRNAMEVAGQIVTTDPPAPSSVRPDLTAQHDEICRRLLAKDARDRFQSADEVHGALHLLSTGTGPRHGSEAVGRRRSTNRYAALAVLSALLVTAAALAIWKARHQWSMPANTNAVGWYTRGVNALRDGSPYSARLALAEATAAAPDFDIAYVRLAEAETELDDLEAAQAALLRVGAIVRESQLPFEHRTRISAIRGLMLRDGAAAISAYRSIAERSPRDPAAWVDLGRAQESFALLPEALESFDRAISIDSQYAAAHLRRASILGSQGRGNDARAGFGEAERLYRATANVEGQVEAMIRRGYYLNAAGDLNGARDSLNQALQASSALQSQAQAIRARLTLSSVIASAGNWNEAEQIAAAAVQAAIGQHLETIAADGLVDYANVLFLNGKLREADRHLVHAVDLAEGRRAYRISARAKLQRASIMEYEEKHLQALETARWPAEYFEARDYRRLQLTALAVMSRAQYGLRKYSDSRAIATRALNEASALGDDAQAAEALENLAAAANAAGALSEALEYRTRKLEINRRQAAHALLPYDLVDTADLLIRLGRSAEGEALLDEIDRGIANRPDAYAPRARRAQTLRLMNAAIQRRPADVESIATALLKRAGERPDFAAQFAAVLLAHVRGARPGPTGASPPAGSVASVWGRELRYWDLLARLARNDPGTAQSVEDTLAAEGATLSPEFEWRVAAIGAAAAQRSGAATRAEEWRTRAEKALALVRAAFKTNSATYESRPDLLEIRRQAALISTS